jgi:carboxymethylenebutenolidase
MDTGTIDLAVAGTTMPCYEAVPDPAQLRVRGAVVVLQEAFGVNAHIEDVTRRFADAGYHAVAPHLFHRTGSPTLGYDDFGKVMPHMQALSDEGMLTDVDAVLAHLRDAGLSEGQTGVVGFCMGGRAAFLVAGNRRLGAAVSFYGGGIVTGRSEAMGSLLGLIPEMPTPWLGLFGDADQGIPSEDVERLREELAAHAPVDTEIVRYPHAEHGFHCDARPSYQAAAAIDGWNRTLVWLESHLGDPAR